MTATLAGQVVGRTEFSGQELRQVLGSFATGVTVVTTSAGEHGYGMTANSFSSVSLDPPLVLVCAIAGTEGSEVIARNGKFAVNILAADQEPISRFFASKDRPRGAGRLPGRLPPDRSDRLPDPRRRRRPPRLHARRQPRRGRPRHLHRRGAGPGRGAGRPAAALPRRRLPVVARAALEPSGARGGAMSSHRCGRLTRQTTTYRGGRNDADAHAMPVVRHSRRRRRDVLHVDIPQLEDSRRRPLRLRRAPSRGNVMTVTFELDGQEFVALNGGPDFPRSPRRSRSR